MPNGRPWQKQGLRQVLQTLREHPKWRNRVKGDGMGYGVAVGGWPGGVESAAACVRANTDGTFHVIVGAVDITGAATSMRLIAAEILGVDPGLIRVVTADTDQAPYAGMSGGSKTTYTVGTPVKLPALGAPKPTPALVSPGMGARGGRLVVAAGPQPGTGR